MFGSRMFGKRLVNLTSFFLVEGNIPCRFVTLHMDRLLFNILRSDFISQKGTTFASGAMICVMPRTGKDDVGGDTGTFQDAGRRN